MDVMLKDFQKVAQIGLPGFMLSLVMDSIVKSGTWEIRGDFVDQINKASSAVLQQRGGEDTQRIAVAIERDGYSILKAANEDHLPTLMAALALQIVKYSERGIEIEENSFLVSLAIMDEALETKEYGSPGHLAAVAGRMEKEARRLGYFSHLQVV